MRLENLFWVGLAAAAVAGLAALWLLKRMSRFKRGQGATRSLASNLRRGVLRYWRYQCLVCGGAMALCLAVLAVLLPTGMLGNKLLPLAFLTGSVCATVAAFAVSYICAVAAPRVVTGCGKGIGKGFEAAFSASGAAALTTLALALVHVSVWMLLVRSHVGDAAGDVTGAAVLFGLGSALATLLLRGGSLFARGSVDGLIQARRSVELPQDPACVAALAGYAASGAGTAAEAFDAFSLSLLCAMALGCVSYQEDLLFWQATVLPVLVAAAGLACSLLPSLLLRPREREDRDSLPRLPRLGILLSALLTAAVCLPIVYALTGSWTLCGPILVGLAGGCAITCYGDVTTSDQSKPVRDLAEAADQGVAHTWMGGLSLGLLRSIVPVALLIAGGILAPVLPGMEGRGLYALSLAGVGLSALSAPVLSGTLMGSITDCAKIISLLTARALDNPQVCDELAAAGARNRHAGRGFFVLTGSLFGAVLLALSAPALTANVSPLLPDFAVLPVLALGVTAAVALLAALGALLLGALSRTGHATAQEILRQSRDIPGLADGEAKPEYDKCTALCARTGVIWTLPSAALTLGAPLAVWLVLGGGALQGLCATVALMGAALAVWGVHVDAGLDAARRYLEKGRHGGKNSLWHRHVALCCHLTAPWAHVIAPALPAVIRLCAGVALLLCSLSVTV